MLIQAASTGAEKEDDGLRIAWQYRRYLQDKQKAPEPPKYASAYCGIMKCML